jgi:glycosyltransferase involved in cell wall biosynthesis
LRCSTFSWQLAIVGRHADDRLKQFVGKCDGVNLIDDANDLGPIYSATDVALVPIQAGGGTKLKTLEAFAHGIPVISTDHGVRGFGATAGTHYLLAEQPCQFADAIAHLAQDRPLGLRLGQAGHSLWKEAFLAA